MKNKTAMITFFDASVRVGKVIWLASNLDGFDDFDSVEELIEDAANAKIQMHPTLKFLAELPEWALDEQGFVEWTINRELFGFLVELQTPVPRNFGEDGSYQTSGFGHFATRWVYVESMDEVPEIAKAWAKAYVETCRARSKELGMAVAE